MIPNFKTAETSGIYLDNAASTRMIPEVYEAMRPYYLDYWGNPSSPHSFGRKSKKAIDDSREFLSNMLGCKSKEFYFTSGGTESNNWAIKSNKYDLIISSAVEHPSVTNAIISTGTKYIEIPVGSNGILDLIVYENALVNNKGKKILVSIQHANSETGVIQPIRNLADIAHKYGAVFHMDAIQSFAKFDWQVIDTHADMISVSARKIHGPLGIGALYVNSKLKINPLIYGGGQELGMRSGTPDTASIVGFAKAAQITSDHYRSRGKYMRAWLVGLYESLNGFYENVTRNGDKDHLLPNIINMTFPGIDSNLVCAIMDSEFNVMCSTGSACSSESGPSKTLIAMGVEASSSFRISLGIDNTDEDVIQAYTFIQKAIKIAEKKTSIGV